MNRAVLASVIVAAASISAPADATITTVNYSITSVVNGGGTMALNFDTNTSIYTLQAITLTIEDPQFFSTFHKSNTIFLENPSGHLYGCSYDNPAFTTCFTMPLDPSAVLQNTTADYWQYTQFGQIGYENNAPFTIRQVAVPEPATWALILVGFGAVGFAIRWGRVASVLTC
jgi:hypothetical protein